MLTRAGTQLFECEVIKVDLAFLLLLAGFTTLRFMDFDTLDVLAPESPLREPLVLLS